MIYKSPGYFLPSFESTGLSVQEKKFKIDFQYGDHGGFGTDRFQLFLSTGRPDISYKFRVNLLFDSDEEVQNRFSRWRPWRPAWNLDWNIFSYFYLKVAPIFPTKLPVNWPFGSVEEVQNRFLRWWPWRPSWISDQNDLSYIWSTSHLDTSYQVLSQLAFRFRRRSSKYIFKTAAMAAKLDLGSERFYLSFFFFFFFLRSTGSS